MSSTHYRIGLIGDHISTSLSPMLHTAEAQAQGLDDFQYEIIDLAGHADAGEHLGDVMDEHARAGFTGFNITHPYKQQVIQHLAELSPGAQVLGAVNNVIRTDTGWVGYNTDHSGFLAGLRGTLPPATPRSTVVLFGAGGAGGAGTAVAAALLDYGVQHLYIIDPQATQLEHLSAQLTPVLADGVTLHTGGPDMASKWVPGADAVVNATPIGMEHLPGTPFDVSLLSKQHWVAEVVYRPVETELLKHASSLGCPTVEGTAMLVAQAADTFELQTGLTANRQRMRAQLQRELAAVTMS